MSTMVDAMGRCMKCCKPIQSSAGCAACQQLGATLAPFGAMPVPQNHIPATAQAGAATTPKTLTEFCGLPDDGFAQHLKDTPPPDECVVGAASGAAKDRVLSQHDEEHARHADWCQKEMVKACEFIRSTKDWPKNVWPSPSDRVWVAAAVDVACAPLHAEIESLSTDWGMDHHRTQNILRDTGGFAKEELEGTDKIPSISDLASLAASKIIQLQSDLAKAQAQVEGMTDEMVKMLAAIGEARAEAQAEREAAGKLVEALDLVEDLMRTEYGCITTKEALAKRPGISFSDGTSVYDTVLDALTAYRSRGASTGTEGGGAP